MKTFILTVPCLHVRKKRKKVRGLTKWISRASVLRIIDAEPVYSDVINEKTYMASQINDLPTKEETSRPTQRPHGEWKYESYGQYLSTYKCSNCGFHGDKQWICCPYYGADMRKEGESSDKAIDNR